MTSRVADRSPGAGGRSGKWLRSFEFLAGDEPGFRE